VRRLGHLLDHPVGVSSLPGRGSCFHVTMPRVASCENPQGSDQADPSGFGA
jgi:hypothetical protein